MKFKPFKRAPVILAVSVLAFVCGVRLLRLDFFERLERMTYDLRSRAALHFPAPAATNLAFVSMEESSIAAVKNGKLGYRYGLYWPRQVYGRLVEELSAQGAKTIAFDVLFGELRHDHPPVQMADGSLMESDDFFALQMRRAGNVLLAVEPDLMPPDLFLTNALAPGDISTERDSDGVSAPGSEPLTTQASGTWASVALPRGWKLEPLTSAPPADCGSGRTGPHHTCAGLMMSSV